MKTLYIIRHGQTLWNAEGRLQGRLDSGLTPLGREQVLAHGRFLKDSPVTEMIVSPLGRTIESAHLLNSTLQLPITEDPNLMERDSGDWSGLLVDDIERHFPRAWEDRQRNPYSHRPPNGENHADVLARLKPLLDSLFERVGEDIALVCHGIVSRMIVAYYLGLSEEQCMEVRHPNHIFYRLKFHARDIETDHVVDGVDVRPGLLRHSSSASMRTSHIQG